MRISDLIMVLQEEMGRMGDLEVLVQVREAGIKQRAISKPIKDIVSKKRAKKPVRLVIRGD